jgi:2-methylcitrate dehydratase PrpD
MGTTEKIAKFVSETDYPRIPPEAVRGAKDAILDGLGVTIAGSEEPAGRIVAQYVRDIGGNPQAGVIGSGFRSSAPQAALANGTMAHALDYDDVLTLMSGHATVPILPVVLSLGEMYHRSGKEVLEAFIVGVEVEGRIGAGIGRRHYAVGWHSTATLGTLGAAAAAAKLLDLGITETRNALGISASEASGLRQNFGTMTKPFHAGNAAKNGIVAAMLAQKGFTASQTIMEDPFGFCSVLAGEGEYQLEAMTKSLGDPFAIVDPGLDMKPYPCCRVTHRCIDAMLHIVEEHHPRAEDVTEVTCYTGSASPQVLIHHQPKTALEGKFSMEYCMARALLDREIRMVQFSEEKLLDSKAQELLRRVKYVHPQGPEGERLPSEVVTVILRDGKRLSHEVFTPRGAPDNPLSGEELIDKYKDCASLVLAPEAVERSLELVANLEEIQDISELVDLVTSKSSTQSAH